MRSHRIATLNLLHPQPTVEDAIPTEKRLSQQELEAQRAQDRRRRCGRDFQRMADFLSRALNGETKMRSLVNLAELLGEKKGRSLDRAARRTKEGLICWFCESIPDIETQLIGLRVNQKPMASKRLKSVDETFERLYAAFEEEQYGDEGWLRYNRKRGGK
jgi:hypothetical protein